jgi:hypothetical protein
MPIKTRSTKPLRLSRETLRRLGANDLQRIAAGAISIEISQFESCPECCIVATRND